MTARPLTIALTATGVLAGCVGMVRFLRWREHKAKLTAQQAIAAKKPSIRPTPEVADHWLGRATSAFSPFAGFEWPDRPRE